MLSSKQVWTAVRTQLEIGRQYHSAGVTAEALVWHHGKKGLEAAVRACRDSSLSFAERIRAELVVHIAADRYLSLKEADADERDRMMERWSRRRGQMIRN